MSFLSRFTKSKDRSSPSSSSSKPSSKSATTPSPLIPLDLPATTLLHDTTAAAPLLLRSPPALSTVVEGGSSASSFRGAGTGGGGGGEGDSDLRSLRSVDTTPWVEVAAAGDGSPQTVRTRVAEKRADPERERREWVRCEKARLGVSEVTLVVDECGGVIRSRGLTTLGLFRPYRLAESRPSQLKLILLFLDYCAEFEIKAPGAGGSIRGSEASKAVLLHAWREELRYAEVLDVVAVVKWALRHLTYPPSTSFSGTPTPSLTFYTSSFLPRALSSPNAFSAHLLPSLPPSSQRLLLSTLALAQHVAAFASRNAMPARRLCRLLGIYLFGLAPASAETEQGWEKLYADWQAAGDVLEGCLRAYLREQTDLPPRLQDLLVDYEEYIARQTRLFAAGGGGEGVDAVAAAGGGRQVAVIRVEVETRGEGWKLAGDAEVNDQLTGLASGSNERSSTAPGVGGGTSMRRRPVEILLAAFEAGEATAVGEVGDAGRAWRVVLSSANDGTSSAGEERVKRVVEEETWRALQLLGLDRAPRAREGEDVEPPTLTAGRRRRMSLDQPNGPLFSSPASPYGSGGAGGAKSVGNLLASGTGGGGGKRLVTPSWENFATSGFSASTAQLGLEFDGANEFGLSTTGAKRSQTIAARGSRPSTAQKLPPKSRLVSVSIHTLDEEFVDAWLDTLAESRSALSPVAGWPGVVVSPLRTGVVQQLDALDLAGIGAGASAGEVKVDHLFVLEKLLPLEPSPSTLSPQGASGLNRALSSASTRTARTGTNGGAGDETLSPRKRWKRRASAIFSSSSSSLPTVSSTATGSRREASDSTTATTASTSTSPFSTLLPSARRSRKSFAIPENAPPVPALPTLPPLPQSPPAVPNKELALAPPPAPPTSSAVPSEAVSPVSVVAVAPSAVEQKEKGGLVRGLSREIARRASRVSLGSSRPTSSHTDREKEDLPPLPMPKRDSQLYVSEVPLTPGADVVPPSPGPMEEAAEKSQEEEKSVAVEPYRVEEGEMAAEVTVEATLEQEKEVEQQQDQEQEKAEVLEPLQEMIAIDAPAAGETDEAKFEEEGLKPAPSPFNIESPIDPSTPLPASQPPSLPLPDVPAPAAAVAVADPIGVEQLEAALIEGGALAPEVVPQQEEPASAPALEDAPPVPALPEAAAEPVPAKPEELVVDSEPPAASTSTSAPDAIHHPEQSAEDAAFAVEKPDVLRPETVEEVAHIEDVAAPAPARAETNDKHEGKEEFDLDLPAASATANEPTTPTFTLSPPPVEKELPEPQHEAEEQVGEGRFSEETVKLPEEKAGDVDEKPQEAVGLGLANLPPASAPSTVDAAPPATPTKSLPPVPASTTPRTPTSPALAADDTLLSRSLSQGSQTSPVPTSPTPSNSSTGSRKFLSNMGSMLRRKKSGIDKEAAKREKEEAKQLRKLREEELKREKRERKAPTPVSNVKARVKEIEEEESATGGTGGTNSPATPARVRTLSQYGSPLPGSPSPAPSGLPRPASIVSLRSSRPVSPAAAIATDEPTPPATGTSPPSTAGEPSTPAPEAPALVESVVPVTSEDPAAAPATSPLADEEPVPRNEVPALVVPPQPEENVTGEILPEASSTPAQESEHLHVKMPATLDDLPSPLPSPSPQPAAPAEVSLLASDDDTTQPIPKVQPPVFVVEPAAEEEQPPSDEEEPLARIEDDHTGPIPSVSITSPAPAQESEHLHVKVPSSFDDLPSPVPSPTPREEGEVEPLAEDLTETIPEIKPPVFVSSEPVHPEAVAEQPKEVVGEHVEASGVSKEVGEVHEAFASREEQPRTPVEEQPNPLATVATSPSQNEPSIAAAAPAFPSTPTKPSVVSAVDSTPNGNGVHSTPVAPAQADVFSSSPSGPAAVEATPTKPGPPPALAHVIRASPSQYSIATTTSFQTADSSAQSSDEHWEAPQETF
ncbi:hypothetical protein JCM6882_000353 [Rhodosporidiobolus microsporus]